MILWLPVSLSIMVALLAPFSALSALLILPVVLAASFNRVFWERNTTNWLVLGWLFWLPVSLVFSQAPGLSIPQAAVLLCLPLAWLAGSALFLRNYLDLLLTRGLPVLLLILLAWGLLQGPNTFTQKPQGPLNDPNTYAALLNLLILPFLARYLASDLMHTSRWLRTGQLALLAAVAFVAFLVSSRGATLALILVLPPIIWLARNQPHFSRKLVLLASVTVVAYLTALSFSVGQTVTQRLFDTVQEGDPYRIMLMQSAGLMILDHPWLGTGLGSFRLFYPQYRFSAETVSASGWVHNDYLQLWLEAGLPMFMLMMGLVAWVAWAAWRTLREGGREALLRMGYITGIGAIMLHALVNFLFFFALVGLLVGLYLAKVSVVNLSPVAIDSSLNKPTNTSRAVRLASGGYAVILGYLLLGQVAVESLLGNASFIQRTMLHGNATKQIAYPRYQVAYWLSVLAPFHPSPQHIMGLELSSGFLFDNRAEDPMRNEALARMAAGRVRAPCYLPYANDALAIIHQENATSPPSETLRAHGQSIITRNLECNARHGLSYYHAGWLTESHEEALMWWRAGLAAAPNLGDRLLLATSILARTMPIHSKELTVLAGQMAQAIQTVEANPGLHADQVFWSEVQQKLMQLTGPRILELVPPPVRKS